MLPKLTGMLSSGRAVIATAVSGTRLADVLAGKSGVPSRTCGHTRRFAALHSAVGELAAPPALRRAFGANAREYAIRHLGREEVLLRFERDLIELTQGTNPMSAPRNAACQLASSKIVRATH